MSIPARPDLTRETRVVFTVMAVVAFGCLLALGLGMTFFADEWAFIEQRSLGDPTTWLGPHNEHWSTLPILLYRLMVETIGIGSYVPYLAVVAVLHVAVAALVYLLLEHSSGPRLALAGGILVLFFGSGFENLYWGFQTGFIGSLGLGLGAMVVTDRGPTRFRVAIVAVLLLAAMMCSTIGVIVAIAIGVEWMLDRRWRDAITALLLPAMVLLAWVLTIGRTGVLARDPLTFEALAEVPTAVLQGMGSAVGSIVGLPVLGPLLATGLLLGIGLRIRGGVLPMRALAILSAVAAMYVLIGLARGRIAPDLSELSRYTYVSGILTIVALGDILRQATVPAAGTGRSIGLSVAAVSFTLAAYHNGSLLLLGRDLFLERADMTRALVTVALDPTPPAGAQLDRSLVLVPSPVSLRSITDRYGDPRHDVVAPFAVGPIPADIPCRGREAAGRGSTDTVGAPGTARSVDQIWIDLPKVKQAPLRNAQQVDEVSIIRGQGQIRVVVRIQETSHDRRQTYVFRKQAGYAGSPCQE